MNIYDYLFYRISGVLNKKHNNEWGVMYALSILVGLNIGIAYIQVFQITKENFEGVHENILIILSALLFIGNYFIFLHKDRYKKIENKYRNEPVRKKKIRGILIGLYIVITFLSIFFV